MRVRLTARAEVDLDRIAAYLSDRSPQGARRVRARLDEAFDLIEANPFAGRKWREGVRRLVVGGYPYLIFYDISEPDEEVRILTVRHAARRSI